MDWVRCLDCGLALVMPRREGSGLLLDTQAHHDNNKPTGRQRELPLHQGTHECAVASRCGTGHTRPPPSSRRTCPQQHHGLPAQSTARASPCGILGRLLREVASFASDLLWGGTTAREAKQLPHHTQLFLGASLPECTLLPCMDIDFTVASQAQQLAHHFSVAVRTCPSEGELLVNVHVHFTVTGQGQQLTHHVKVTMRACLAKGELSDRVYVNFAVAGQAQQLAYHLNVAARTGIPETKHLHLPHLQGSQAVAAATLKSAALANLAQLRPG